MIRLSLKRLGAVALAVPLALFGASAFAMPTQLGFAIDGSGSISGTEFNTQISGLSSAFNVVPTDSSVEVTIVQFSSFAQLEIGPLVIDSVATRNSLINQTQMITQIGGGTTPGTAINLLTAELTGSANFGGDSLINLSTDGGFSLNAAQNSANSAKGAGIDALTAEGIGFGAALNNLRDLVFGPMTNPGDGSGEILATDAAPGNPLDPGVNPWVVPVSDFSAFGPVIQSKLQAVVVVDVPVPASVAFLLVGIVGLAASQVLQRRRRQTGPVAATA